MYQFQGLKAAYFTLGCKLNFAETSSVSQQLQQAGIEPVRKGEIADICIVNTCSVTEVADHKCRQAISRMVRLHPGALVVVMGCYAQLKPQQVADLDGVDLVLGSEQKGDILRYIAERLEMMPEERALAAHEFHTVKTADPLFPEGSRWLRLLLHLLHDSYGSWQKSKRQYRLYGGAGSACCQSGRARDCHHRRQHW